MKGALVKVVSNDKVITLRRPLYPLEVPSASVETGTAIVPATPDKEPQEQEECKEPEQRENNYLSVILVQLQQFNSGLRCLF